jgi:hypothetical protein
MSVKPSILRINMGWFGVKHLIQPNTIVVYDPGEEHNPYPKLERNQELLFLGEVKNAPGHGLFVDLCSAKEFDRGKIQGMYHLEYFWIQIEGMQLVENKTCYGSKCFDVVEQDSNKEIEMDSRE